MDLARAQRRLHLACRADTPVADLVGLLTGLLQQLAADDGPALVRIAYWQMPDVPTAALERAVRPASLDALAGRGPLLGSCSRCGRGVRAQGREDIHLPDGAIVCPACREVREVPLGSGGPAPPTWEFEDAPVPWRPLPTGAAAGGRRRWAEHYALDPTADVPTMGGYAA